MRMSLFNRRKKPIIVTIHGFGRNLSHEFDSLARYLKAKKYEVIQFDMYDLNNPNDANHKDWVQRCEAKLGLAIKENPNVILIGFSMGGVIASYLASIYKVQSLILCAPAFEYLDIKKVTGLFKKSDKPSQKLFLNIKNLFHKLNVQSLCCMEQAMKSLLHQVLLMPIKRFQPKRND